MAYVGDQIEVDLVEVLQVEARGGGRAERVAGLGHGERVVGRRDRLAHAQQLAAQVEVVHGRDGVLSRLQRLVLDEAKTPICKSY